MPSDQRTIADDPGRRRLATGTQIGSHRIEAELGEGGMGAVYRALDTKLNRPVAIKLLSNELADADARRRIGWSNDGNSLYASVGEVDSDIVMLMV